MVLVRQQCDIENSSCSNVFLKVANAGDSKAVVQEGKAEKSRPTAGKTMYHEPRNFKSGPTACKCLQDQKDIAEKLVEKSGPTADTSPVSISPGLATCPRLDFCPPLDNH